MLTSSFVVQSPLGDLWSSDASDDSSPLVGSACLTGRVLLVNESTTEELAVSSVFPHVVNGLLARSDSASWKSLGSKSSWESPLLEHIERSADLGTSWGLWLDWDGSSISDPSVSLESVPVASNVLEDIAVVMPESLVPGPSDGGESSLGWAPVVPLVVVPSVPDFA